MKKYISAILIGMCVSVAGQTMQLFDGTEASIRKIFEDKYNVNFTNLNDRTTAIEGGAGWQAGDTSVSNAFLAADSGLQTQIDGIIAESAPNYSGVSNAAYTAVATNAAQDASISKNTDYVHQSSTNSLIVRTTVAGTVSTYTNFNTMVDSLQDYDSVVVYPGVYPVCNGTNYLDNLIPDHTGVRIVGIGNPIVVVTNMLGTGNIQGVDFQGFDNLYMEGITFDYGTSGTSGGGNSYNVRFDWSTDVTVKDCVFQWYDAMTGGPGDKNVIVNGSSGFKMIGGAIFSMNVGGSIVRHLASHDADTNSPPRFYGVMFGSTGVMQGDDVGELAQYIGCYTSTNGVFDGNDNVLVAPIENFLPFTYGTAFQDLLGYTPGSSLAASAGTGLGSGESVIFLKTGQDFTDTVPDSFSGTVYLTDGYTDTRDGSLDTFYDWNDFDIQIIGLGRNLMDGDAGNVLRWERCTNGVIAIRNVNFTHTPLVGNDRFLYMKQCSGVYGKTENCTFNMVPNSNGIKHSLSYEEATDGSWSHSGGKILIDDYPTLFTDTGDHEHINGMEVYTNGTWNAGPDFIKWDAPDLP